MDLTDIVEKGVAAAVTIVLGVAAISDIRHRRIPNWTALAVVGLFVVWAVAQGGGSAIPALEAAGVALVVSVALYALKILGAGDSKLFTAVALFAGMVYLPLLATATVLAGGVLALFNIFSHPRRAAITLALRQRDASDRGVPYGVAIAIGGVVVVWGSMAGLVSPFGEHPALTARELSKSIGETIIHPR